MDGLDWLVVRSKPGHEKRARQNLLQQGAESYLPYAFDPVANRHGPLFRSYLFVLADKNAWGFINYSYGVRCVLTFGEQVATISRAIIEGLKASEINGVIQLPKPGKEFEKGDELRIKYGAFVGQLGIYQGMNAHQRVYVLMNILNRATRVALDRAMVEKTGRNLAIN